MVVFQQPLAFIRSRFSPVPCDFLHLDLAIGTQRPKGRCVVTVERLVRTDNYCKHIANIDVFVKYSFP